MNSPKVLQVPAWKQRPLSESRFFLQALQEAQLQKSDLDAIAYTAGPGLIGALLAGACFAKSLAFALNIQALAVHHLEAHILAAKYLQTCRNC